MSLRDRRYCRCIFSSKFRWENCIMDATITESIVLMLGYPQPPPIGQCSKGVSSVMEHGLRFSLILWCLRQVSHRSAEQGFTMRERPPQLLLSSISDGYSFSHWTGGASGSDNPLNITINSSTSITANFSLNQYSLLVNAVREEV